MKSSSGARFLALDHVRALAAFLVVAWHFVHGKAEWPLPFGSAGSDWLLAPFDEGRTGVAVFMTLSGYLFAKLLQGKPIDFPQFLKNRALRLLPLLCVVIVVFGLRTAQQHADLPAYIRSIAVGMVLPTLPAGGWSITVELHFYLLLPLLLWISRRGVTPLLAVVGVALLLRAAIFFWTGEVSSLAYWTIVGRIDQFALGMVMHGLGARLKGCHWIAALAGILLVVVFGWCDSHKVLGPDSPAWIALCTVEGFSYAVLIAWYDLSFRIPDGLAARALAKCGEWSYSVYLWHFAFVFQAARLVDAHIMHLTSLPLALAWSLVFYVAMLVPASLSYRFIERPFLRQRARYVKEPVAEAVRATAH